MNAMLLNFLSFFSFKLFGKAAFSVFTRGPTLRHFLNYSLVASPGINVQRTVNKKPEHYTIEVVCF